MWLPSKSNHRRTKRKESRTMKSKEEIEKRLCELSDELRKHEHSRSRLAINDLNARMGELEWVLKDEMWKIEEDEK